MPEASPPAMAPDASAANKGGGRGESGDAENANTPPSVASLSQDAPREHPAASAMPPASTAEAAGQLRQRTVHPATAKACETPPLLSTATTFVSPFSASSACQYLAQVADSSSASQRGAAPATLISSPPTIQVSAAPSPAAPLGRGVPTRWQMPRLRSLLKKGTSRFTRKTLWDYCDEWKTRFWDMLQLSPGEREETDIFEADKKGNTVHPLRLDRPAGVEGDDDDEELVLEDEDDGRMNIFPRRFAYDKRERAYIRSNHCLVTRRFSEPYRLGMTIVASICSLAAFGALFWEVVFPAIFLGSAFRPVPLMTFGAPSPLSILPARAFALSALTWAACLLIVAASVSLPVLVFLHTSFRSFSSPSAPILSSSRGLSGASSSASAAYSPYFSLDAPFNLLPPTRRLSAASLQAPLPAHSTSHSASPSFSSLQDAEDAFLASTFLRIYHRCVLGDFRGAETVADSAAALARSSEWRHEQEVKVEQRREDEGRRSFEREDEERTGGRRTVAPVVPPRALARAMEDNKKLYDHFQRKRRESEARKALMCSITDFAMHPSAVKLPSSEEEEEKRQLAPLLALEDSVRDHIVRSARMLASAAIACYIARALLLLPVHEARLLVPVGGEPRGTSPLFWSADDSVRIVSASPLSLASPFPLVLDAYARWLSVDVAPIVLLLQFAAAALLVRPREELGVLRKLMRINCFVLVCAGAAQLAFSDASTGLGALTKATWVSDAVQATLVIALGIALRAILLYVLLLASGLLDKSTRQLFLARFPPSSALLFPASSPFLPALSPGVLCATSRTAAAAATILTLAIKKHNSKGAAAMPPLKRGAAGTPPCAVSLLARAASQGPNDEL
ncbi:hypothetical protein BESB_004610 [Besnoitia besnoiti]|uniref:Transmembrane protein n=1 Tax=Besnoitia besnoiti TaxID=94643 RepID=A0A2A9MQ74_BESBE|nr:hypothetical protein BESB_004610 [Besnoitia besnoiti]PFH38120.1 hypothetical protein BESB_004610 [Besnoitia besnoiti]